MGREAVRYAAFQIGLGFAVGGSFGVLPGLVLVLDAERAPEVAGQQVTRAAGEFHCGGFNDSGIHNVNGNAHNGWIVHHNP